MLKLRLALDPALALAALACFASAISAATADEVTALPSVRVLRAHLADAAGTIPPNYRLITTTHNSDGTTSVTETAVRDHDRRSVSKTGPLHTEVGISANQHWHQNANGQTVLDALPPDDSPAADVSAPVVSATPGGYTISALDRRGFGTIETIDAATWHIVRREIKSPQHSVVTTYDEYRTDAGWTFAHHVHAETSQHEHVTDEVSSVDRLGAVTAADVAIAPPLRRLVEFPSDTTTVVLPARFFQNRIAVRVMVNGRGLDLLLDTGASGIFLSSEAADSLGLPHLRTYTSSANAGVYDAWTSIVPEMHVGSLVMHDVAIQTAPLSEMQNRGETKIVGLLGSDFLAELGVTIDYEHGRVTAVPGEDFSPPADALSLPLRIGNGQPMIEATVNGARGYRWVVDTGGVGNFMIGERFMQRHPEAIVNDERRGAPQGRAQLLGAGGVFSVREYKIHALDLGNAVRLSDFHGFVAETPGGRYASMDGLVGPDFLHNFTVALDYGNSILYLIPNAATRGVMHPVPRETQNRSHS